MKNHVQTSKKKQKEARERANQLLGQLAAGNAANKDIKVVTSDDDGYGDDNADDNDTGIFMDLLDCIY